MRKLFYPLLLGAVLTFSLAFSQGAASEGPTFKSQFAFLTYFDGAFDARTKDTKFVNFSDSFFPLLNLSWRATFNYKQINIYTRMYIIGDAHKAPNTTEAATGFYYRFDRGYVTYTPLSNLSVRWGLTTSGEKFGGDYLGQLGTANYGDSLSSVYGSARDLAVYVTYDPTSFLTVKPFLQAPPFRSNFAAAATVRETLTGPATGVLQGSAFAKVLGDNYGKAGSVAGTGVKAKDIASRQQVLKTVLVTPTYGAAVNLHFFDKKLEAQIAYQGTASATQGFTGWVQYSDPQSYFGAGVGGAFSHDYLFVKGQRLGMVDLQLATYFGEKRQHHIFLGNAVTFAHVADNPIYGTAPSLIGKKKDYISYKLSMEATFSAYADNPDILQISLGYYLSVPPKNVRDTASDSSAIANHTVEIGISNFI